MKQKIIYLDNAATSFPKPREVVDAMVRFQEEVGANPGRSGHRLSIEAARIIYEARELVAELFGIRDSSRVIFGMNATDALNLGIRGILRAGDHVITSSMEHNSVMRPLRWLEKGGLELTVIPCSPQGLLGPGDLRRAFKKNTKMCILNHGSNVVGTLQPLADVGEICRNAGIIFFVDAAQTAGAIGEGFDQKKMIPLKTGGTGSRSEFEEQPDFLPDLFECGTPNGIGLAGLKAGLDFIRETGLGKIREYEICLTDRLLQGLARIPRVTRYGLKKADKQCATVSFNIEGLAPSEVSLRLDEEFGVLCRVGLHCAPSAHKTIGTFPQGTVRFSLSYLNNGEEVDRALRAVSQLAKERA
ncbi:MAG: aminotransferase class V-fold PLP-dependent enzyme [Deltaproteobacteria bacterium]|nr:aminotransferase class V-fold PLP-dependent enzyme [Deltaproteobacteria bacterium]